MTKTAALEKTVRELLFKGFPGSQIELVEKLNADGYDINQSKISRLLRKLGAVRVNNAHQQLEYRLSKEPLPTVEMTSLVSLIVSIKNNEHMIVLQTTPGGAQLVARWLDYQQDNLQHIGTIAGDDTILIIPKSVKTITTMCKKLKALTAL